MRLPASPAIGIAAGLCAALAAFAGPSAALAAEVAVVAPLSGPFEPLGAQLREAVSRSFPGDDGAVEAFDTACTAQGGKAAAEQALAAGARILIGFLCTESLQGAVPVLAGKSVPVLSVGVRTDTMLRLTERNNVPFYRLAPGADAEAEAVGRLLPPVWREANFAILDDGTIGSRDLAEGLRAAAEAQGLKPVLIDTFRPQLDNQLSLVQRLEKAGATHAFAAGDRSDLAIMARDAAARGIALTLAGGETLEAADSDDVPLADGVLMIGLADWSNHSPQTIAIAEELRAKNIDPSRYYWRALAAGEIAAALLKDPSAGMAQRLSSGSFQTTLGPVSFDAARSWTAESHGLYVLKEGRFVPFDAESTSQ